MKRRVLLAVLPVFALVVAAGSGDTTSAAPGAGERIHGETWSGSPGITVPVSALMTQQRAMDWRFTGGARDREPPEREGNEEPGEEEAPPKRPPSRSSAALTEEATVAPRSQLSTGTSFLGAHMLGDSSYRPPDSMGSVGPSQVLVAVNGRIRVFDKNGAVGPLNVTDGVFWSSVNNQPDVTDPEVEYDRLSGRWIVSQINFDPSDPSLVNNRIMLAVSSGPTITSTSSFTFFFFDQNGPNPATDALFADYPQMGVDANAIYIGTNDFAADGSFAGTTAFVIDKADLLAPAPALHVTAFRGLTDGTGPGPDSPQPAQNMEPNTNAGYIVGPDNQTFGRLDVLRVNNPGAWGMPTPPTLTSFTVSVPNTQFPEDVPQDGPSADDLDALDDRLFEAMIGRDPSGNLSLWTAHNIGVTASGIAPLNFSNVTRDAARWYQIGNLGGTPTLLQSGTLFDPASSNPRYFWIPSIAMNGQGHASLNASTAGNGRFAEVASTAHLFTDPTGTTEPFQITQTSSSVFDLSPDNPDRWGDYSQTAVDPTDNQTFWTFQEYTNANDDWGVQVIKLLAPPPATPSAATPAKVPPGQSSVSVQLTGTSLGGSGFFDPGPDPGGPGYPRHISATATGGVTVNSVAYDDPTHVTLNLSTVGVPEGTRSGITVTNPDGQSTGGADLILISSDVTAPDTTIGKRPKKRTRKRRPTFTFTSSETGSTFECQLDSGAFAPCSSPFRPTRKLKPGKHVFRVRAIDAAENVDRTPAAVKFRVLRRR